MHRFGYSDSGDLLCESVKLREIAEKVQTPTFVYSSNTIRDNYHRLKQNLNGLDLQICYAQKANSNISVIKLLADLGAGFDIVSGGELRRVIAAGGDTNECVFAGVGKTEEEIRFALEVGVFSFHVESEPEIARIDRIAGQMGKKAPIAIRVNPDVDANTHAKITTGKYENKFGIPLENALAAYEASSKYPNIVIKGVQMHIGSQLTDVNPFVQAVTKVVPFVKQLQEKFNITYFSVGGGIGIVYKDALESGKEEWWNSKGKGEKPITAETYGSSLLPLLKPLGLKILLEPGRSMVGNAGVLLSKVEYLKVGQGRDFLVLDAAMNDLVRPAMYESYHEIVPLEKRSENFTVDVVGPICESGDCFAKGREMQKVGEGDFVAFMSAGAYGYSMSSRYNTRPMAAEVLVQDDQFQIVNKRETFERQIENESIPSFLK
eukprot:TRINITY_DN2409_c0_g1_i1.p1 TRINITY_DN2409_c0_g1~~TRINITY_DN2409_c0_g1_i1.p1  ORF type:complete len:460 (-),score=182.29 TRINITY_DN2409_c0_g1_i1:39-1340(-)